MADGNSDIGFARLCFVQQFDKGRTKVLKLSAACGHLRRSVQNLERQGSSSMVNAAEIEIPYFAIQILLPGFIRNVDARWLSDYMPVIRSVVRGGVLL
jgi:hypothetical protein